MTTSIGATEPTGAPSWRGVSTRGTVRAVLRIGKRSAAIIGASALTTVTPPAFDRPVCAVLHRAFVRLRPERVHRIARRMEDLLGDPNASEPSAASMQAAVEYWRMRIEVRYGEARGSGLRGWKPDVTIEGLEHLEEALSRGDGAILWRMTFTSATVVNAALAEAGHRALHLSSEWHARMDDSWWSRAVMAPFITRSEARWLDRRVIKPANGGLSYLKDLRDALGDNRVVTITGDLERARHMEGHPVANMVHALPTGAPSLAHATGASLHTCVPLREGPFCYRLLISPDLGTAGIASKPEARRLATEEYARQLEHHLRTSPESSMWWGRR